MSCGTLSASLGRENGVFGLEAHLEPKTILSPRIAP